MISCQCARERVGHVTVADIESKPCSLMGDSSDVQCHDVVEPSDVTELTELLTEMGGVDTDSL